MAVSRGARAGCSTAFALSCARMSGEALTSAHWRSSPPLTAIADRVLARARSVPLREAARDGQARREPLERAPRRRVGDVLAPQRLARILPAAKRVAVARPEDAVVLGLQHLHRGARKAVGSEHFVLSVGAAPEADGH